ncbi:MAG: esterase, partial [Actinobacteria bacterium]
MKKGRVVRPVLQSELLRGNRLGDPSDRVTPVYLPPSYDESPNRRYPMILAIVGFTGTGRMLLNEDWFEPTLADRVDALIDSGEMNEAIVVMPDGATRYGGSQYMDSAATGPYGRYTAVEVIAWADREFRTIPRREARGVFGKSSGGYGSFRMAVDYPEVFSAFACHSGDSAFEYCYMPEFPKALRYLWHKNTTPKRFLDAYRSI